VRFTAAQQRAIEVSGRLRDSCVVAGPGSGKTTVLVEYFRELVESGVDPLRILAITFTEKAAGNMRDRLARKFEGDLGIRGKLERAWVSTVHGFCTRLLKENAVFAGVDPEFYVADEHEAARMRLQAIDTALEEAFQQRPGEVRSLIRGLEADQFEEAVLASYDAMRGAGVTVAELRGFPTPGEDVVGQIRATVRALRADAKRGWNESQREHLEEAIEAAERVTEAATPLAGLRAVCEFPLKLPKCKRGNRAYELAKELRDLVEDSPHALVTAHYAEQRQFLLEVLERFDAIYRARKRAAGALDFADLEEFAVALLAGNPEVRGRVRGQFDHILMDEFQDTNGQQARLLELVRPAGRFYAVGDINQSIFGFRHAEPDGFRKFREEVALGGGRLVELVDNFRSRAEILRAVETIAGGARGIENRALVAGREFEKARAVCVEVMAIDGEAAVEAQWVARRIVELLREEPEFTFRNVAVLFRNTDVLADFTKAFDDANIPYVVNYGRGFYETDEVKDLTHLLRVIANPRDEISLAAVLRSPLVGMTDEAIFELKQTGRENLGEALRNADGDFARRLRDWRVRREFVSFDRLLLEAIDGCEYPWSPNVDRFLGLARKAAGRWSLDEFIADLELTRAAKPRERDAPPEDSSNAVQMMTVHAAKGLEFPIVFLAAMHKGIDVSMPPVAFSRKFGLGARWRNPATGTGKNDVYAQAIKRERDEREKDESERLLYVAMTRAEQHLVMSFSGKKNWADVVTKKLGLDAGTMCDLVCDFGAWKARVLVTDHAPELLVAGAAEGQEARGEVELLARPRVTEQYDSNATVTALARFAVCPRAYYLGHFLGFEGRKRGVVEAGDVSASDFGTEVHELLAGVEVAGASDEARKLAAVFRQSALGRRAERAARVEREFDFLMAVGDIVVRGQIDLWFEEGGETVIVDYKTDSVNVHEAHQRAREYALQVRLYALAVEKATGHPPARAWLHFLRPNLAIEVDLSPSLLDSPEQVVRDFQAAQESREFPLVEGEGCLRCQFFKGMCPAGLKPRAG